MDIITDALKTNNPEDLKSLFSFNDEPNKIIIFKFNLWARHFFGKYFVYDDAPFHNHIDNNNLNAYRGFIDSFLDIGFRGAAKTARTKLFMAFCIANDQKHFRKHIKVLAEDITNSKQVVTDVYNMLINPEIVRVYPEIFQKTTYKREETMGTFTTATGIKIIADTVGTSARGALAEESRPDFIWFEDFENRKTLRSPVVTQGIWDNMEEAKNSLSVTGSSLYNCNYVSERGNVHKLVIKADGLRHIKLITPLKFMVDSKWESSWKDAFTMERIDSIERGADDFPGEFMCQPSAGADIFFDRSALKNQEKKEPIRNIADFKIFHSYDPSHRYGIGADVAGGVGLDSSTSVIIDFSSIPSKVVATYNSNTIKPNIFGDELFSQADRFGAPVLAVENNKFDSCIERLRAMNYDNIYFQEMKATKVGIPPRTKTLGWNTNRDTKPKMLFVLRKAVIDGHLELSDPELIKELWSYSRDDLMDGVSIDPRLSTRHFDLLIACAIAYMMKDFADVSEANKPAYKQAEYESPLNYD